MAKPFAPSTKVKSGRVTKSLNEWAADLGCKVQTLIGRIERGMAPEKAVVKPVSTVGGQNRGQSFHTEVFTREEMTKLLESCNDGATGARNRALIVIGWRSGLRCSEALKLHPKDLMAATHTLRVLEGKGDKSRTTGMDEQAWSIVNQWQEIRRGLGISENAPLLCTLKGTKMSGRYVRGLMVRLAEKAGINKRVHFHALRHTMAFELAQEEVPMHLIQQQLGHSNLAVTSRYISHLNPAETVARMAARNWNAALGPTATSSPSPHVPPPGWLDRLRSDIGQQLFLFHDARTNSDRFRAVVLLMD